MVLPDDRKRGQCPFFPIKWFTQKQTLGNSPWGKMPHYSLATNGHLNFEKKSKENKLRFIPGKNLPLLLGNQQPYHLRTELWGNKKKFPTKPTSQRDPRSPKFSYKNVYSTCDLLARQSTIPRRVKATTPLATSQALPRRQINTDTIKILNQLRASSSNNSTQHSIKGLTWP